MNFTPDVIMVRKDQILTGDIDGKGGGNIIAMIKFLVQPLIENTEEFIEKNKYFVIAIGNYVTSTRVMEMLRDFMIGVEGTARICYGWPGKNVKEIYNIKISFNEIFWSVY